MVNISNNIITMYRGDTFSMPVLINYGTKFDPKYYTLTNDDTVYLGIETANQKFEDALIKKVFTSEDLEDGTLVIKLSPEETEYILPGTYFYEIRLVHKYQDSQKEDFVDTIARNKFIILE